MTFESREHLDLTRILTFEEKVIINLPVFNRPFNVGRDRAGTTLNDAITFLVQGVLDGSIPGINTEEKSTLTLVYGPRKECEGLIRTIQNELDDRVTIESIEHVK